MSAAPEQESPEQQYRWPIPPPGGWTADDLDRIPGLPPHAELIDGSLVFVSPRTLFHMRTLRLLEAALYEQVPDGLDVFREFTVILDKQNRPEPDVMVVPIGADTGPKRTRLAPEDVLLAVEIVSEDSEARDREVKPRKYAHAGIAHFWRVERGPDELPVVYVYEIDPATKEYALTGIHHDRLKLSVPFDLDIDLTAVNERRRGRP